MPGKKRSYGSFKGGKSFSRRWGNKRFKSSYGFYGNPKAERGRYRTTVSRVPGPLGVADQTLVALKYSQQISIGATAGALATHIFSGNSCFDPDVTGTGHQPFFFDQWAAFYADYTTLGSRVKITPCDQAPTAQGKVITLVPSDGKAVFTTSDQNTIVEQPYAKTMVYQASSNLPHLTSYMSTGKIYGLRKDRVNTDSIFIASTGSSPTGEWYWHIGMNPLAGTANVTIELLVEITYYVKFSSRNRPSPS